MSHHRSVDLLRAVVTTMLLAAAGIAQETPSASLPLEAPPPAPRALLNAYGGARRALVICGLPGDADHRKLFAETLELLFTGLTDRHGFAAENMYLLWGDKPEDKDGPAIRSSKGVATRESIAEAAKALRTAIRPDDTFWVFVLGHAHYDGRYSWLNIAGDDIQQLEFGRLFEGLRCREQVFFMTTAASGFFLKPLAAPGRVVIAATEPDSEINETLFPHKLARAVASPPAAKDFDMDSDGRITLLDLYLWTARETAQEYAGGQLLATEHAMLDDNGDGRGTEVQIDYLSEELGGRRKPVGTATLKKAAPIKGDGALAQRTPLAYPDFAAVPAASLPAKK